MSTRVRPTHPAKKKSEIAFTLGKIEIRFIFIYESGNSTSMPEPKPDSNFI